jgi:hypothetical protein
MAVSRAITVSFLVFIGVHTFPVYRIPDFLGKVKILQEVAFAAKKYRGKGHGQEKGSVF